MHPQVADYLRRLTAEAQSVLGDQLLGSYAAGSVAMDAYEPGASDVDVAVVTRSALPPTAKQQLVARLRHEALPCPARGLELVVYSAAAAASGTADPAFELELNTGAAMPFRATYDPADRPAEDGLFWYGLDRSILHQHGRALVGPPAAEVFADLPGDDVRALLAASLRWWLARTALDGTSGSSADAVLGACRALVRHRTGRWETKQQAALTLVEHHHPEAALLQHALAARRGAPPPDPAGARAFQQAVLRELEER